MAGFGPEQQFFVGYAQSWCAKYREENLRLRAVTDPHSPARFRVNGPLSNLPEFAAAFRLRGGDADGPARGGALRGVVRGRRPSAGGRAPPRRRR